jgi:hypothetical protein
MTRAVDGIAVGQTIWTWSRDQQRAVPHTVKEMDGFKVFYTCVDCDGFDCARLDIVYASCTQCIEDHQPCWRCKGTGTMSKDLICSCCDGSGYKKDETYWVVGD